MVRGRFQDLPMMVFVRSDSRRVISNRRIRSGFNPHRPRTDLVHAGKLIGLDGDGARNCRNYNVHVDVKAANV